MDAMGNTDTMDDIDAQIAIMCSDIYKLYPLYHGDFQRLKGLILPRYRPQEFTALSDISISFKKGEISGIVGLNGSGKSTLANIITGITYPTKGELKVDGDVNMLSANAGMENHLTGVQNIHYKCLLMGITKREIKAIQRDIIDFADIGIYIDQPLRTYSSGMRSRLGFSISVHVDPDILIIDEALSVGDNSFAEKCLTKMDEFKRAGKTILFISHSVGQMQSFCDRIIWLHNGRVIGIERPENILRAYCDFAREFNAMMPNERRDFVPDLQSYREKYL